MDIASFAVGFALGRRKGGGGGGGYRDSTFHYILDNYIPVYTHIISSNYTLKFGLCLMYDGNYIKGMPPDMDGYDAGDPICAYDSQAERGMYLYSSVVRLAEVSVVYKKGVPIYAGYHGSVSPAESLGERWTRWNKDNYSSAFFYKQRADYRLDSATLVNCTYFTLPEPTEYRGYGEFDTDLTFTFTISYQKYRTQTSNNPPSVWVEKDGDRVTDSPDYAIRVYSLELVAFYDAFTDMATGDFYDEIQNVYYEACVAAGYSVVPMVIKYPID